MKILMDECVDWRLAREITGHEVRSARQMGWATIKNGELLKLAVQSGFEIFLTVDTNLSFQQHLRAFEIRVVVLRAPSNRLADLKKLIPKLLVIIETAKPGAALVVSD